jgi:hypothetical protein
MHPGPSGPDRVQLHHHECVSRPAGCECKPESGPVPVRAGQDVIDADAVITEMESTQGDSLCSEILLFRYARIPPKFVHHLGLNPSTRQLSTQRHKGWTYGQH